MQRFRRAPSRSGLATLSFCAAASCADETRARRDSKTDLADRELPTQEDRTSFSFRSIHCGPITSPTMDIQGRQRLSSTPSRRNRCDSRRSGLRRRRDACGSAPSGGLPNGGDHERRLRGGEVRLRKRLRPLRGCARDPGSKPRPQVHDEGTPPPSRGMPHQEHGPATPAGRRPRAARSRQAATQSRSSRSSSSVVFPGLTSTEVDRPARPLHPAAMR